MDLFEDIKVKSKASGFPISAIAERAGISTGTPTHWAQGRSTPNQSTYNRMMNALQELISERDVKMRSVGL